MKQKSKLAAALASLLILSFVQPASALTMTLEIPERGAGQVNELFDGSTQALATILPVPHQNEVLQANTLGFLLSDTLVGQEVNVTANNALLVTKLHSDSFPVRAGDGVRSLELRSLGGNPVSFFAYTTSSAVGAVSVTHSGATTTYYLKGSPGPAYDLTLDSPSFVDPKGLAEISVTVKDVFGNLLDDTGEFNAATELGLVVIGATASSFSYSAVSKAFQSNLKPKAGQGSVLISVAVNVTAVDGFTEPKSLESRSIKVRDIQLAMATLETRIAELKKSEKTARKAHNKLAKKWNLVNATKVKLLKKPKRSD